MRIYVKQWLPNSIFCNWYFKMMSKPICNFFLLIKFPLLGFDVLFQTMNVLENLILWSTYRSAEWTMKSTLLLWEMISSLNFDHLLALLYKRSFITLVNHCNFIIMELKSSANFRVILILVYAYQMLATTETALDFSK